MLWIHREKSLYSFGEVKPAGDGWEFVAFESFNALRESKWNPVEYVKPVTVVTRRQLLLWLHSRKISKVQIKQALASLPADAREVAEIEFDDATTFDRSHPLVSQLGAVFGLSAADIDAGFVIASNL
jgi:hypothetical protein